MYIYVRKLSSGLLLQQRNEGRRRTIALALWFQADLVHTVGWVMILITPLKTCRGFVKATNLEFFYLHSAMWILVTNMAASCFCLLPNVTSGGLRTIRIYQCSKCKNSRELKNAAIFGAYISFFNSQIHENCV